MLTNYALFIVISIRINAFYMPIAILPFRSFLEILEGFHDFLSLFIYKGKAPRTWLTMVQLFIEELQAYGSLDFIDVNVKDKKDRVKIKMLLR